MQEEHGNEHAADSERRDQCRKRNAGRTLQHRLIELYPLLEMAMGIFDGHCGVVDQNADRKRQPAERHGVDRLSQRPHDRNRGQDR